MEPTNKGPSFDESVAQVMQTLPPSIRSYLGQGKYTSVAKSLMAKYSLRIDQGGVLERGIMLLLMGIDNPDEFVKSLVEEAKLNQQTVNNIVRDVNDQIFVPLREEMRKGTAQMGRNEPLRNALASITKEVPPAKLLEDHEEPHIEFKKAPPPNLPGAIYHSPLPTPPSKPYSSDPYREPLDEK